MNCLKVIVIFYIEYRKKEKNTVPMIFSQMLGRFCHLKILFKKEQTKVCLLKK